MNEISTEDLIEEVNRKMKEQGLSVQDLANMLGTSRRSVYNWLKRKNEPSLPYYYKILKALKINRGRL